MQRAKAFFYVCAGLLMLALSYHLGATNAGAQAGSTIAGFSAIYGSDEHHYVITSTGDVWLRHDYGAIPYSGAPTFIGNFWDGTGAVNVQQHSLGELKARFRSAPAGK